MPSLHAMRSITNGGRALNLIWKLNFTAHQKLVLLYLGSQMDFTGDFTDERYCSVGTLVENTGLSEGSVKRAISELVASKYLCRQNRTARGKKLANGYCFTDKLFKEYLDLLEAKEMDHRDPSSRITEIHLDGSQRSIDPPSSAPASSAPSFLKTAPRSERQKFKIVEKYITAIYKPRGVSEEAWDRAMSSPEGLEKVTGVIQMFVKFPLATLCEVFNQVRAGGEYKDEFELAEMCRLAEKLTIHNRCS